MTSIHIIEKIAKEHREICTFCFYSLEPQRLLQDRMTFGECEQRHFERAMLLRSQTRVPFWDAVMLSAFDTKDYSFAILKAALEHNDNKDILIVPNNELLNSKLADLSHENYGWNSSVKLKNGKQAHIPLLDFHAPVSKLNTILVTDTLHCLGLKGGYLMNSGESYHYIHHVPIGEEEYRQLMIQTLFYSPIIDRLWVAHQLKNGSSMLRIGRKHGVFPKLIRQV